MSEEVKDTSVKGTGVRIKEVEKIDKKNEPEAIEIYSGNEQTLTIVAGTKDAKCMFRIPFGLDLNFAYDCCREILQAIKATNDEALKKKIEEDAAKKVKEGEKDSAKA